MWTTFFLKNKENKSKKKIEKENYHECKYGKNGEKKGSKKNLTSANNERQNHWNIFWQDSSYFYKPRIVQHEQLTLFGDW